MKICCLVTIALFVECCGYAQSSLGPVDESSLVTVRGRLKRTSLEGAAYPIAQLRVTLKREPADAKTVGIETVTSEDGMFYFYKIPPGSYILDISPSEPPFPKNIEVRGVANY